MRLFLLVFSVSLGFLPACKKSDTPFQPFPSGTYKGSFQRLHQANSPVANVTIRFDFPNWTGTSSINKYPALLAGTYRYHLDALDVANPNAWTTDFDHTLIFKGFYIDQVKGDSLILSKSYANGWVDLYRLKKQP